MATRDPVSHPESESEFKSESDNEDDVVAELSAKELRAKVKAALKRANEKRRAQLADAAMAEWDAMNESGDLVAFQQALHDKGNPAADQVPCGPPPLCPSRVALPSALPITPTTPCPFVRLLFS